MRHLKLLIAAAVFLFYVLALVLDRAAGTIFGILVLSSLATVAAGWCTAGQSFRQFTKQHWLLDLAMAGPLIATLINLASTGHFDGKSIDLPSRLAMFALIFWVVQFVPHKHMKYMQWAFPIGAMLAVIKMVVLTDGGKLRYGTDFIPIIIFSEMALLLGFFSACSIAWNSRNDRAAVLLKLLAVCATLYAAYISGSRGPWVTIPVFAVIACVAAKEVGRKYKIAALTMLVAGAIVASQFSGIVRERIALARSDIAQYSQGTNVDTSLGVRFQIWRGSWVMFKEHPIFGVGVRGYQPALQELADRKVISPYTATYPHSHNEILFMMARLGLFGLIAILAVYFVPAYYFMRALRNDDREVRSVGSMGLALCIGILGLGLTDVVFLWWEIFPFYAISIAFFLTYIGKRKDFLQHGDAERDAPRDSRSAFVKPALAVDQAIQ